MGKDTTIPLSDAIVSLSAAKFKVELETDPYHRQWLKFDNGAMSGRIRVLVNATGRDAGKRVNARDLPCPVGA